MGNGRGGKRRGYILREWIGSIRASGARPNCGRSCGSESCQREGLICERGCDTFDVDIRTNIHGVLAPQLELNRNKFFGQRFFDADARGVASGKKHPVWFCFKQCLADIVPRDKHVEQSLTFLDFGVEPIKGRSIPVLEVATAAKLNHWLYLGEDGDRAASALQVGRDRMPGVGLFRTFIYANQTMPAIVGINHKSLKVRLNGRLKFQQDSFWSGDQQINVELFFGGEPD